MMVTENIKELSEKLAKLYGVDAFQSSFYLRQVLGEEDAKTWLAEDSGRISDLADENGVSVHHGFGIVITVDDYEGEYWEEYKNHPSKSAAARMARVRCLIAIKESI